VAILFDIMKIHNYAPKALEGHMRRPYQGDETGLFCFEYRKHLDDVLKLRLGI
jgi:hypothetical protein